MTTIHLQIVPNKHFLDLLRNNTKIHGYVQEAQTTTNQDVCLYHNELSAPLDDLEVRQTRPVSPPSSLLGTRLFPLFLCIKLENTEKKCC